MTAANIPARLPHPAASAFRPSPLRLLVFLALAAAAVATIMLNERFRVVEASAARPLLAQSLGRAEQPPGSPILLYPSYDLPGALRGLRITYECTSAVVIAPMLAMGAVMALLRRFSPVRVVLGVAVASACLFAVNLARITIIAVATRHWGPDGFELTHRIVGSGIVLVAATLAFVVTFRVIARQSPAER